MSLIYMIIEGGFGDGIWDFEWFAFLQLSKLANCLLTTRNKGVTT